NYCKKLLATVTDSKVKATFVAKENKELLEELGEDSEINYIFVLVPQIYPMCRSEDSKEVKLNFALTVSVIDNFNGENVNYEYSLKDVDNGNKYSVTLNVKKDAFKEGEKLYLKFEELKPSLNYNFYNKSEENDDEQLIFSDISFITLVGMNNG
ncbi:hypothetical protein IJ579_03095, partial [bacterium]|nr:hypothetical protein [bacterium]